VAVPATEARSLTPAVVFDGEIYWYTKAFDPGDDRCCSCRAPIDPHCVPLMLFKEVKLVGRSKPATWLARFCERCSRAVYIRSRRA
jgi:hypothetical protein